MDSAIRRPLFARRTAVPPIAGRRSPWLFQRLAVWLGAALFAAAGLSSSFLSAQSPLAQTQLTQTQLSQIPLDRSLARNVPAQISPVPVSEAPPVEGDMVASSAPSVERVRVGFQGKYKLGYWTPVQFTVAGGASGVRGRLEILAADGDGVMASYVQAGETAVDVPADERRTIMGYARFGRSRDRMGIRIRDDKQLLLEHWVEAMEMPEALPATRELLVTVGPELGVDGMLKNNLRSTAQGVSAARVVPADLPDQWCGYESVDVVLLATSDAAVLDQISDLRLAALERWIRLGGRLLWCVGQRGGEVFGDASRWNRFAPGTFESVRQLRDTSSLESFAGAVQALDAVPGFSRQSGLSTTTFSDAQGQLQLVENVSGGTRVPLLIQYSLSFGQVMLVALDLDLSPFDEWTSRPRLLAGILQSMFDNRTERLSESGLGQVTHVGYEDMVGQLRGALDQFPDVTLVAFSWVAVLIGVYILLIGPGDYFLLRKVLGRMHWSWITFPLVVIGFCVLAWYLVGRARYPSVLLNQVDVLDFDTRGKLARGTTWAHVYSPQTELFDLSLPDWHAAESAPEQGMETRTGSVAGGERGKSVESSLLSWQGLPGKGLGGMGATRSVAGFPGYYQIRAPGGSAGSGSAGSGGAAGGEFAPFEGSIRNLPIPVSATRSLIGRRWFPWDASAESSLEVRYDNNLLRGSICNPLPVTLTNCALLYGDWVYPLTDDMPPGAVVRLEDQPSPRVLEWRLTRRRVVEQEAVSTRWDSSEIEDVTRIVEVMMFHRAAGGQRYTQLSHRYQGYLDLSQQLRTGRAILVGRSRQPAVALARNSRPLEDGARMRSTFCRVLFPVQPAPPTTTSNQANSP